MRTTSTRQRRYNPDNNDNNETNDANDNNDHNVNDERNDHICQCPPIRRICSRGVLANRVGIWASAPLGIVRSSNQPSNHLPTPTHPQPTHHHHHWNWPALQCSINLPELSLSGVPGGNRSQLADVGRSWPQFWSFQVQHYLIRPNFGRQVWSKLVNLWPDLVSSGHFWTNSTKCWSNSEADVWQLLNSSFSGHRPAQVGGGSRCGFRC